MVNVGDVVEVGRLLRVKEWTKFSQWILAGHFHNLYNIFTDQMTDKFQNSQIQYWKYASPDIEFITA